MKKFLLVFLLLFSLSVCASAEDIFMLDGPGMSMAQMEARVIQAGPDSLLVLPTEEYAEFAGSSPVLIDITGEQPDFVPRAGDILRIQYSGSLLGTDPAVMEMAYHFELCRRQDYADQIQLILEKEDVWREEDIAPAFRYSYTVCDLDHNGRLEVFAASTQGTGIFTYGTLHEVNEDHSDLLPCRFSQEEGDCLPEVILSTVKGVYDWEENAWYYLFTDTAKGGPGEYCDSLVPLCLKDGNVCTDAIARVYTTDYEGTHTTEYHDPSGPITEDEYNAICDGFSAGRFLCDVQLDWFPFEEAVDAAGLEASLNCFLEGTR